MTPKRSTSSEQGKKKQEWCAVGWRRVEVDRLDAFVAALVAGPADEVSDEHDEYEAGKRCADDDRNQVAHLRVGRAVDG